MAQFEFLLPQKLTSLEYGVTASPWNLLFLVFQECDIYGIGIIDTHAQVDPLPYFEKRLKTKLTQKNDNQAKTLAAKISKDDLVCKVMGTPFQHQVWKALLQIPEGQTRTYSEVASRAGNPKAIRATGTAIGQNPISILIPCHRALPKSGGIGNFLWGTKSKQRLLQSEGHSF